MLPAGSSRGKVAHGSIFSDNFGRCRVKSQWQSTAPEGSALWIHDDEHGDVEAVIRFVLRLAEELDLTGLWGIQHGLSCSRPRLDAFGGGAHVIDLGARKSIGWTSTEEWLTAALNREDANA